MNTHCIQSINPSDGSVAGSVPTTPIDEISSRIESARRAQEQWMELSQDDRDTVLRKFATVLTERRAELSRLISLETGKPHWEGGTEVTAMINKVEISIRAQRERCASVLRGAAHTRYKPQGVLGVLGPFNFPGHLPNGHITPALLAGNAVVFKPSEQTPLTGAFLVDCFHEAGIPTHLLVLIQGGRETGEALARDPGLDGLLFTGSAHVGEALGRLYTDHPGRILALEMGGNNPLIVDETAPLAAAVALTLQSAFITAGQRCTCARRLIVPVGRAGDHFLESLARAAAGLRVGDPFTDPAPFLGPVINAATADRLMQAADSWQTRGAVALLPATRGEANTGFITPGIYDVTTLNERGDDETFGPLLQVIRVADFPAAIDEANRTAFGLAAGLISESRERYETFFRRSRAGIVNWNVALTGASSEAPFGGVGRSGNHRPSAYYAADYCSFPVASMEATSAQLPAQSPPGFPTIH